MIVEGKKIADEIILQLLSERSAFPPVMRVGVVMSQGNTASTSFVKIKERVADKLQVVIVREEVNDTAHALRAVERLSKMCEGVLVQLPLLPTIDTDTVLAAIPPHKDIDAENPTVHNRLIRAPVAEAVSEIFARANVSALGKKAVVVGEGRLVGAPVAELLRDLGAKVTVVTLEQGSLDELKDADIVVSGAGSPGLINPTMLKEGIVLIDAGASEANGRLAGDATPECAEVASVFSPVPGGVGPIAVAMLFKNLFKLAKAQQIK